MRTRVCTAAAATAAALLLAAPATAAPAKPPARAGGASAEVIGDPRLNGFWNIDDAARAAVMKSVHAELSDAGKAVQKRNQEAAAERTRHGEYVSLTGVVCGYLGAPFWVTTSEPWELLITKDEVVQTFERDEMLPRHFYMDGRSWADLAKLPPAANGYSIAHWEGKDFVIETRGMPPGGLPGGGLKGPKTILTERVSLNASGDRLSWNFRWEDPELLAKPYSYTIEYDRAPPQTYAFVQSCDPAKDPGRLIENPLAQQGGSAK